MTSTRLDAGQPLQLNVFGFSIDQPPPAMTEFNDFQDSPTEPVDLATSTTKALPSQTIRLSSKQAVASFDTPGQPGEVQLAFQSSEGASFDSENERVRLPAGAEIKLSLDLDSPLNFSLNLTIAVIGTNQFITIEVNGTHLVSRQPDSNQEWHWVNFTVPAGYVVPGVNTLKIYSPEENYLGFWVANAQVSSEDIPLQASYYWTTVSQGSLTPGASQTVSTSLTTGVTKTQTDSFTETVGVSAGLNVYSVLNAKLNFSFSATQTTSIATTESQTITTTIKLSDPPKQEQSVSYQVWQLVIRFAVIGGSSQPFMDQACDPSIAPLMYYEALSDS